MKFTSYWLDTAPRFSGGTKQPFAGHADVVVVGAGLTGCSAGLALAEKGAKVLICEAETVGNAASGRNGGMCNNGFAQDYGLMAARYGRETATKLYRSFDEAVDTVEKLVRENDIDCSFARVGKLKLAAKPEHFDKLARAQELLRQEADPDTRIVGRSDLRQEVGTDRYYGGLIFEKSAGMHVGRFVVGLAEAAAQKGAQIYEHTPVTGLRRLTNGKHEVTTPRGRVIASQVLLASGISHTGPFGWVRRRIVPVGAFIIVTEPLSTDVLDRLLPRRRMTTDTKNLVNYFRNTPDNRLLFGGRARFAVSNPKSDAKSGAILREAMVEVFPELADARVDYCWGGMVDMTRDRLPRAGERDGVYYSMGYSGHGTQMSTYMGRIMAEVMDGRAELNPWRDMDWPAIPGHIGPPWFLPLVGAYYRLIDRFA